MEEAASIPLVGLTAWQALVERARVKKGRRYSPTPAPAGSGPLPFNSRSSSARPSRPRRAAPTSNS